MICISATLSSGLKSSFRSLELSNNHFTSRELPGMPLRTAVASMSSSERQRNIVCFTFTCSSSLNSARNADVHALSCDFVIGFVSFDTHGRRKTLPAWCDLLTMSVMKSCRERLMESMMLESVRFLTASEGVQCVSHLVHHVINVDLERRKDFINSPKNLYYNIKYTRNSSDSCNLPNTTIQQYCLRLDQ